MKVWLDSDVEALMKEGRGIAAGYVVGYRTNRPASPNDTSCIGRAQTAGYNARALYPIETFDVVQAARSFAENNHD
jgi:hypothetical protein